MNHSTFAAGVIGVCLSMPWILGVTSQDQPEPTQLPVGHPAVDTPNPTESMVPAAPEDVVTIDAIVDAYYDALSGPKDEPRDWERFISLFMPDARFITSRMVEGNLIPFPMSVQGFVDKNRGYIEGSGYFEKDIHRVTHEFGSIAQVFSTYAARRAENDPEPYTRGINSIQLMKTGGRWWITTIMWDHERPEVNVIDQQYLPEPAEND